MKAQITDYLDTQGLKLALDEVYMACLTVQAVLNMADAEIEHKLLWHDMPDGMALTTWVPENTDNHLLLRQMYLALDSVLSRCFAQSAVVYVLLPAHLPHYGGHLLKLVAQGQPIEALLPVDETACWHHIASRSAQTGWLNQVDDVTQWLGLGELQGENHLRCQSQLALPVYADDGHVLGVVYAEDKQAHVFDAQHQAQWVALALMLLPHLQQLHTQWQSPQSRMEDNND